MSSFFSSDQYVSITLSGETYVTCSGTVIAPHGAGIARKVVCTLDNNPNNVIGNTVSTLPAGSFSVQLPGLTSTEFTVLAKGLRGENDAVYGNCKINVEGPPGLYIAPPLDNIPFIVGPGNVTSPFVDVQFPVMQVDSEWFVDIRSSAHVDIPSLQVSADFICQILSYFDVNIPAPIVDAVIDNYLISDFNIGIPIPKVNAFIENMNYAFFDVHFPPIKVDAEMGANFDVSFPHMSVSAEFINIILSNFSVEIPKIKVSSNILSSGISAFNVVMPVMSVSSIIDVDKIFSAEVHFPSMHVNANIEKSKTINFSSIIPKMRVYAEIITPEIEEIFSFKRIGSTSIDQISNFDISFNSMKVSASIN